jgi:hypothetical protein
MSLFAKKQRQTTGFWRAPPFPDADTTVLYQFGIRCVGRNDGPGMIATGWAIWHLGDLSSHQAYDFLTDGYDLWRRSAGFDPAAAAAFLRDLIAELRPDLPARWTDLHRAPPELVDPIAKYYSLRCWAGSELLEVVDDNQAGTASAVFDVMARTRSEFVPERSLSWARGYASQRGLPDPWP